jgi:hypothetical protein
MSMAGRVFLSSDQLAALFGQAAPLDAEQFLADIDVGVDQSLLGD